MTRGFVALLLLGALAALFFALREPTTSASPSALVDATRPDASETRDVGLVRVQRRRRPTRSQKSVKPRPVNAVRAAIAELVKTGKLWKLQTKKPSALLDELIALGPAGIELLAELLRSADADERSPPRP